MPTFFSWIQPNEVFDSRRHARSDLEMIQLIIQQYEGEVALATVTVPASTRLSQDRQYMLIAYMEGEMTKPIFRGRLTGLPMYVDEKLMQLQFTAEPLNAALQLATLGNTLKKEPYWDELFIDPLRKDHFTEVLEARSALYAWDRVLGEVVLSDLFQGRKHARFEHCIFADSLKLKVVDSPLESIQVCVVAEWIQSLEGEANVAPYLARHFSDGMINTVTPEALKQHWPKSGARLGRSGYTILASELKEVTPPYTGGLNLYPTVSKSFQVWDQFLQKVTAKRLKRHWYRGKLILSWSYRQKRREIVNFTLKQTTAFPTTGKKRQLTLVLQAVGDSERCSFFLTDRGCQAVAHAIEIAKCHLASTARCVVVEAMIPFLEGVDLSLDHSITLCASTLPTGQVTGKLVAYRLVQENSSAYAWLRIALAIGGGRPAEIVNTTQTYMTETYGILGPQGALRTASHITFNNYMHQKPTHGFVDGMSFSMADLIEQVVIQGDGAQQVEAVLSQQYPVKMNPLMALETLPTQFQMQLMDLQNMPVAEHVIQVDIPQPWSAPCQFRGI